MVLNDHREKVDVYVVKLSRPFVRISPNAITGISVILSVCAALAIVMASEHHNALLVLASVLIFVASVMDAIDGKVARLTGNESRLGDFLDHVSDRYNDMIIIGSLAFTIYARPEMVLFALTGVFMVSYMGTQAQAVGCSRDYGGLLGRADRLVMIIVALPLHYLLIVLDMEIIWKLSFIEWVLLFFALAGHITALQRFRRSCKALAEDPGEEEKK